MEHTTHYECIFTDGSSFFNALIEDIHTAQKSIDVESYIFNGDQLGERITQALIAAVSRGVQIRVLVDGAGTPVWGGNMTKRLEKAGIETRIFHPLPWRLWHWNRSVVRLPFMFKAFYLLSKINSRNHRKTFIIDKRVAFLGSFNITRHHLRHDDGGSGWRDTGIRLSNVELNDVLTAFDSAWNHTTKKERLRTIFKHVNQNPVFRLNNTRHRRRILYKNLLRRMKKCKDRIWITNAYFVPDNFLLKHLSEAALRGLDVRILLPRKSDFFVMPWASSAFYYSLLKSGVRIFEYLPNILHAKTLILDDWMTVGSSNLNHRSLFHDLEIDVNIRLAESKAVIQKQFLTDLATAKEIQLDSWHRRPWYQRLIGRVALYMKYWI